MPDVYFQSQSSSFPQTSENRTRTQASVELLEYTGGANRPEAQVAAARAWDSAVREFNTVGWRFNRRTQNITLVASTPTYALSSTFRSPIRAVYLDTNSKEQWQLEWMSWEVWVSVYGSGATANASLADYYTAFNIHNQGTIRLEPSPGTSVTWPTLQVQYLARIALATDNDDRLNVPVEVDEAVFQLAAATLQDRVRGGADSIFGRAKMLRLECEREHREWPEPTGWGANG